LQIGRLFSASARGAANRQAGSIQLTQLTHLAMNRPATHQPRSPSPKDKNKTLCLYFQCSEMEGVNRQVSRGLFLSLFQIETRP
jgi:hypothetical protein